jgi:hypothetical protein
MRAALTPSFFWPGQICCFLNLLLLFTKKENHHDFQFHEQT